MKTFLFATGLFCLMGTITTAHAQVGAIMVQQPVINTFGVETAGSVPDWGNLLLGGISSAAAGSYRYGLFPYQSQFNWGAGASSSSVRAHVRIHDLPAMDEALLSEGKARAAELSPPDGEQYAREVLKKWSSARHKYTMPPEQISEDRARALQILRARR